MSEPWNDKDPNKWKNTPLVDKIEYFRKQMCTGPCDQSVNGMQRREELNNVFNACKSLINAIVILQPRYEVDV